MKVLKGVGYWVLSYTWGILLTLLGSIVALALLCTGHKPHRFHYNVYFIVGKHGWGGLEFGPFFLTDINEGLRTKQHEAGHGLQNIMFGPLGPFLINIPSGFRYWFRRMKGEAKKTKYVIVVTLLFLLPGLAAIICGIVFSITWLWIIGAIWCAYFFGVCCVWQATEIPKYNKVPYPYYDDFWCEGMASKLGMKYFPEEV